MVQLESGALHLPYTNGVVSKFRGIMEQLVALVESPDLTSVVDNLFPEGQNSTRDIRAVALLYSQRWRKMILMNLFMHSPPS